MGERQINIADVEMAVVVQRLVPADVAGALFTANPRTGSPSEMLIEASWGLGEAVVSGFGSRHKRIPPKVWTYNSDVETVHGTIEQEFCDLENFESIRDFHQRVASYQAWYNLVRPNMNKDDKSPWQIIQKLKPKIDSAVARLPPLMLDCLELDYIAKDELSLRGYDLPWYLFHNKIQDVTLV